MVNEKQIKQANKKALPKFLLIILLGIVIGFVIGFYGFNIRDNTEFLIDAIDVFCVYVAPCACMAMAVFTPIVSIPMLLKAKKMFKSVVGDDEHIIFKAERIVDRLVMITSVDFILLFLFLTAVYSKGIEYYCDESRLILIAGTILSFVAVLIEIILIQQKAVDSVKLVNPEKNVSLYDLKFRKKWFDSCDEAEKAAIGKCAYKAYTVTNKTCVVIAGVLAVLALLCETSILPALAVCIIWFVNLFAFYKESAQVSKFGNISL